MKPGLIKNESIGELDNFIIKEASPVGQRVIIRSKMKFTKDDIFEKWSDDHKLLDKGMIVASSCKSEVYPNTCPIWHDSMPLKSVTVVCEPNQEEEVKYWLSYVHGGEYAARKELADGRIALRSNYECW